MSFISHGDQELLHRITELGYFSEELFFLFHKFKGSYYELFNLVLPIVSSEFSILLIVAIKMEEGKSSRV